MAYYNQPEKILPSLNAANQSDRRQRSERREACLLLLRAVIHYTDLATLKVGVPRSDGSIGGLTLSRLSALTQLGTRRTSRAMRDLKRAGILTVKTICHRKSEQGYVGEAAIKSLSPHIFALFGLDRWLRHEQRRAEERKSRRRHKSERKALAQQRLAVDAWLKGTDTPSSPRISPRREATRADSAGHHLKAIRTLLGMRSPAEITTV